MRLYKKLSSRTTYLNPGQQAKLKQAFDIAVQAHQHQTRQSGEPYITHPVAVACIMADMRFDMNTVAAALLHDVIEDSDITRDSLAKLVGDEIADIVEGVSKLTKIEFKDHLEAQAENFRKMIMAMIKDIRVILVKLVDRLHNMRTLGVLRPDKKRRIAQETLDIYAPIARRLGMRQICVELEELSFAGKHPLRHAILKREIQRLRGDRQKFLDVIHQAFQEALVKAGLPTCQIIGREKHLYSIYRKMKAKQLSFRQVMDVYAFRIIVDTFDTCYRVLGLLHSLYKPFPEKFKDYIAIPKVNGYQSLHTTLFGPYAMPIEIQIRTADMDEQASSGVAAHWHYKLKNKQGHYSEQSTQGWLKTLSEMQSTSATSLEFIESVKVDLFPEDVYVFTPKGRIKALPRGATVIDFAYSVHTAVGNHCCGVILDKKSMPLSTVLSSGQSVLIETDDSSEPDSAWLDFVVTAKARASIRHHLQSKDLGKAIYQGNQMLNKELAHYVLPKENAVAGVRIEEKHWRLLLQQLGMAERNDLYAKVGAGQYAAPLVARKLINICEDEYAQSLTLATNNNKPIENLLQGLAGAQATFATCCHPIAGEELQGVINQDHSILVHSVACRQLLKKTAHATVPLQWVEDANGCYEVALHLLVLDRFGAMATVLTVIGRHALMINHVNILLRDQDQVKVEVRLNVRHAAQLQALTHALLQLSMVSEVQRTA